MGPRDDCGLGGAPAGPFPVPHVCTKKEVIEAVTHSSNSNSLKAERQEYHEIKAWYAFHHGSNNKATETGSRQLPLLHEKPALRERLKCCLSGNLTTLRVNRGNGTKMETVPMSKNSKALESNENWGC